MRAATGSMISMRTLARMRLFAITWVASVMRSWARRSRSKARMTRMPRSRSRTRSFCLSQYSSATSQVCSILPLTRSPTPISRGTAQRITRESGTSLRMQRKTPARNFSGMMRMPPQSMEITSFTVPTSWEERVTRLEAPMRPTSESVMVCTLRKMAERRLQQ